MEYLMTYGWAILIIAVVLGALFQLGVFNSSSFSPRAPPGACQVFRPSGPGTTTNINLMGVCTGQLPQYVAQFNGASSYVNAGNAMNLDITGAITISAWIKTTKTSEEFIVQKYHSATPFQGYALEVTTGKIGFWSNTIGSWQFTSNSFNDGNWHYVLIAGSGSSGAIYVDNMLMKAFTYSSPSDNINEIIYIGRYGGVSGYDFNGSISNIQIYNASLSANQVQALYLEGMGGAPMKLQNLIGWWPLNGNSNDYSGNNNNGVPTNVVFTSQYGK